MQKRPIILLAAIATSLVACNSIRFAAYLRVYDNDTLIYHFNKDSSGSLLFYDDTLICKMIVRTGVVRNRPYQNHDVFYFVSLSYNDTVPREIFTSDIPLNQFTYYLEKGSLFMGDFVLRDQNPMFGPLEKIIPKKIIPGQIYVYKNGDYRREITFLKSEDIIWGNMPMKNALKFSIAFSSMQGLETTDTVWLAKNWGMVRWKRIDGYSGELRP